MSKKQQDIPQPNKPFSLRVLYAGHGAYDIVFSYQEKYGNYRMLTSYSTSFCVKRKNFLTFCKGTKLYPFSRISQKLFSFLS